MRFFLVLAVSALLLSGCSPLANRHDINVLNCGSDFEGYEPIQVLDGNSSRLAGKDLEAFEIGPAGKQKVAVSSKGCISGRQNAILVRHMEKSIGKKTFVRRITKVVKLWQAIKSLFRKNL